MTSDNVIHELDGDDNFLDKLDDPQETVLLGSDNEFSDLEKIDEDDRRFLALNKNHKTIQS